MNTPPPVPSPKSEIVFEHLPEDPTPISLLETLLKRPGQLIYHLQHHEKRAASALWLLVCAIFFAAIYGLVVGTFSGGEQLWVAPVKVSLGLLVAVLICLPSLYIFTCLSGAETRISTVAGVFFAAVCVMSLLLIGFAPVAWIFSQSTDSVPFMGALHLLFWIIGVFFGLRLFGILSRFLHVPDGGHLRVWMMIFVLVCLQMMTALRPIIAKSGTFLPTEKKFFLAHWVESIDGKAAAARNP